ncbi:acyl-CoA thioesterase domain-containing protein [Nocardioides aurantiacus]|uniref:acyl-CoA thioesterase domain-containing protein n=1 Tax=Nocardioides aurantiacus TaxID=86796 RepID=UPI00403F4F71
MPLSFFVPAEPAPDGPARTDAWSPTDAACSLWSDDHLHGVAVSGFLARAAEAEVAARGRDDLRAARWTVDLFRPARRRVTRARVQVVRESARLCLVDVELVQDTDDGTEVAARASGLFLRAGEPAGGAVWEPEGAPEPPPADLAPPTDRPRLPLFRSEGVGWHSSFAEHQNPGRKTTWQVGVPVVPGERPSGFVAAASVADVASMVTNWGDRGIEQINTDITLTLARAPQGVEIGLEAADRVSADGIAVGTATVFDRAGRLGSAVVTSVSNAKRAVDLTGGDPAEDPRMQRGV